MQGTLETYVQLFAPAIRASRMVGLTMPGLVANRTFARVLFRDLDAVCNAVELPCSNGQAEGQINRF